VASLPFSTKRQFARYLASTIAKIRAPEDSGYRILCYHGIGERVDGDLNNLYSLTRSEFEMQLQTILEAFHSRDNLKFTPLSSGRSDGTTITFDDGYLSVLTEAAPLLASRSIPFHVFLSPALASSGDPRFLTPKQIVELSQFPGSQFGTHGLHHRRLTDIAIKDAELELRQAREWLEDLIQADVNTMSYPFGAVNSQLLNAVGEAGYTIAASSKWGFNFEECEPLLMKRIDMWHLDTAVDVRTKIAGNWNWMSKTQPRWMRGD